jgi:Na+/H+-translocating membrane pyrophosphatase
MELVESCRTGAATNIIYGLALGYKSVVVPVFILAFIIYLSFSLCDLYGKIYAVCCLCVSMSLRLYVSMSLFL